LFVLLSGIFLSCEKKDSSVIDSIGSAPKLSASSLSVSTVNTDTMNIGPVRNPEDVLTISINAYTRVVPGTLTPVSSVQYTFRNGNGSSILAAGSLLDDGNPPDTQRNDSLYSGRLTFQIVRSTVGVVRVELFAEDASGYKSNSAILPLEIVRSNQPPVLSNLVAPDTVHTSSQSTFLVTVRATDPDGQADIRSVTRTTPSNLVLPLNDAGQNGDGVPGDGIFSETVLLSPPPPTGPYDFRFQAHDRSNVGSNVIIHRIIVLP